MTDIERLLMGAVKPTALAVQRTAAAKKLSKVNERDHLAPAFRDVLKAATAQPPFRTALPGERQLGDRPEWPDVGDVDALVAGPGGPAWVELKCRSDAEALCACAWDAPKVALALRVGRASCGYLLSATTVANWTVGIRGAEYFGEFREEAAAANRTRFTDWWRHWERRPDPLPVLLPARYATERIASHGFDVGPNPYELRLARVSVVGSEDYAWEPFDAVRHR